MFDHNRNVDGNSQIRLDSNVTTNAMIWSLQNPEKKMPMDRKKAPNSRATSSTVLPIGPSVSWLLAMGMMPLRQSKPRVGLKPTTLQV